MFPPSSTNTLSPLLSLLFLILLLSPTLPTALPFLPLHDLRINRPIYTSPHEPTEDPRGRITPNFTDVLHAKEKHFATVGDPRIPYVPNYDDAEAADEAEAAEKAWQRQQAKLRYLAFRMRQAGLSWDVLDEEGRRELGELLPVKFE